MDSAVILFSITIQVLHTNGMNLRHQRNCLSGNERGMRYSNDLHNSHSKPMYIVAIIQSLNKDKPTRNYHNLKNDRRAVGLQIERMNPHINKEFIFSEPHIRHSRKKSKTKKKNNSIKQFQTPKILSNGKSKYSRKKKTDRSSINRFYTIYEEAKESNKKGYPTKKIGTYAYVNLENLDKMFNEFRRQQGIPNGPMVTLNKYKQTLLDDPKISSSSEEGVKQTKTSDNSFNNAKSTWFYNSKDAYNHIKINPEAPNYSDLMPEVVLEENDDSKWWFYHQADFAPFRDK